VGSRRTKAGVASGVDHRKHPEAYRIGRGEEGVLSVEPYKSEILPYWRFKTEAEAKASARAILELFRLYKRDADFVGMDMARKFVQMGYTRSRRYARHRSGRKYDRDGVELPLEPDVEKQRSAVVFKRAWDRIRSDRDYQRLKQRHRSMVARARRSACR
jgi:hypothetical protein